MPDPISDDAQLGIPGITDAEAEAFHAALADGRRDVWRERAEAAEARIARALERHQPETCECSNCDGEGMRCAEGCVGHWPCSTRDALAVSAGERAGEAAGGSP